MLFASNIKLPSSSLIENAGKSNEWASNAAPDFKEKWTKITGTMIFIFARLGQSAQLFLSWKPLNNSNDNDDDDDNDNNDNIKQYQPSERAGERHMSSQKQWCEKNTTTTTSIAPNESRILRNSSEVMHERTNEQLNTLKPRTRQRGWECCVAGQSQDVDVDASMKTMAPGTWTELILSESEKTKRLRLRSGLH